MIQYFYILVEVENEDILPWGYLNERLELGKGGRLCKFGNGLKLNSLKLAERFEKRYIPFLKNKYGDETETYIENHEYPATPVYGPKIVKLIETNSIYAENVLTNQKSPRITKEKNIKNGWIIVVKREGFDKSYAIPTKQKNTLEITTDKKKAKIYQRLSAAEKYAEKFNKTKTMKALIVKTGTKIQN